MESTTRRKVTTVAVASAMALALAVGSAFAGTGNSSGGGADNGTKNGTYSKKVGTCNAGWTSYYWPGSPYDINHDYWVCYQETNSDTNWVDNTAKKD